MTTKQQQQQPPQAPNDTALTTGTHINEEQLATETEPPLQLGQPTTATPRSSKRDWNKPEYDREMSMDSLLLDPRLVLEEGSNNTSAGTVVTDPMATATTAQTNPTTTTTHTDDPPPTTAQTTTLATTTLQEQQETMDRARLSVSLNGSNDSLVMPTPSTPFFNNSYIFGEESGNEDSVIFNYSPPANADSKSSTKPRRKLSRKEKFPSFDSVGSSGSVVKQAAPRSTTAAASSNPSQTTATILPYDKRKQLQKQKQQQQSRDETPPRPERQQQPPIQQQPMMQVPPNFPTPQMPFGMPNYPPPPHNQNYAYPPFPPPGYPPQNFPFPPPPPGIPPFPPPPHYQSASYGQAFPPPRDYSPHTIPLDPTAPRLQQLQQPPPRRSSGQSAVRPPVPSSYSRSRNGGSSDYSNFVADSFDSSDGGGNVEGTNATARPYTGGLPPRKSRPPPPPPPPVYTMHFRQDSNGSVSSLGSVERSGARKDKRSFFERLNPFAQKEHTVRDFHRRNQEFLSRARRQSPVVSPRVDGVGTQKKRMNAMDRPPASRGGHRRLNSIENDDWTEPDEEENEDDPLLPEAKVRNSKSRRGVKKERHYGATNDPGDSIAFSSSELSTDDEYEARESSRLLPPTGISSNEYADRNDYGDRARIGGYSGRSGSSSFYTSPGTTDRTDSTRTTERRDNTTATAMLFYQIELAEKERLRRKKKKKKKKRRNSRRGSRPVEGDTSDSSSSSDPSPDYLRWKKSSAYLEREKAKLVDAWIKEAKEKELKNRWDKRFHRYLFKQYTYVEATFANLPPTIGAIALSVANLGVDWFKFTEENLDSCQPVHFHSDQCTFPEFPGCFYCDTSVRMFKVAEYFHFVCSCFAGLLAFCFIAKIVLAPQVVFDELSSPTTASPAGLLCMTLNVVFAGRGVIGMVIVSAASCVHLCLAIWFMYMTLAYHMMPEPSWFPNTTGIGISAVKCWLYHPMAGHFLMAISLALNFLFFPISLIRVFLNRKISATVGWMQMSAPNVSLYALTIMAQPSFEEEQPDINAFQRVHRMGMTASVYSLVARWKEFRGLRFSPAHAAFCAPCLSHANAVQAYRAAVKSFSDIPKGSTFHLGLYCYWIFVLGGGTCVTLYVAGRYLLSLPSWTHIDVETEKDQPPAPFETTMAMSDAVASGDAMYQNFVSPAVLQANETGALVLRRDAQGRRAFVRTRNVTALGFEPIMDAIHLEEEIYILLENVAKTEPRLRNRTLSVPGVDFGPGARFGTGNTGVYGMEEGVSSPWSLHSGRRPRSNTLSPFFFGRKSPSK